MRFFKAWVHTLLKYTLTILLVMITVNLFINPYNTFPFLHQSSINSCKKHALSDRMTKFYELKRIQPKTVLMGTSRAGIFPSKQLEPYVSSPIYNLSLAGSSISEQYEYLKYAIEHNKLSTIVWSLDFFSFNPDKPKNPAFDIERLKNDIYWPDITTSLISLRTTEKSLNTIKDSLCSQNDNESKMHLYETTQYINMQGQSFTSRQIRKNMQMTLSMYKNLPDFFKSTYFKDKNSINENLLHVANIVDLCKRNNIQLIVYISPVHIKHLELIHDLGLTTTHTYWKKALSGITPYTDFSSASLITRNSSNFRDSSHVTTDIGPLIFARIFNKELETLPKDFGIFITQENADAMLNKQ